jgi:hypothetical protein
VRPRIVHGEGLDIGRPMVDQLGVQLRHTPHSLIVRLGMLR